MGDIASIGSVASNEKMLKILTDRLTTDDPKGTPTYSTGGKPRGCFVLLDG